MKIPRLFRLQSKAIWLPLLLVLVALTVAIASRSGAETASAAANDYLVYGDTLASGWANWSWDTAVDLQRSKPRHSGSAAIATTYTSSWAGLYLHSDATIDTAAYSSIRFWIHGGRRGGQSVQLRLVDANNEVIQIGSPVNIRARRWTQITVPLSDLGNPGQINGIIWQESGGSAQDLFLVDDVVLVGKDTAPPPTAVSTNTPLPQPTNPPPTATNTAVPTTVPTTIPTAAPPTQTPGTGTAFYQDGLASGWQNWSWGTSVNFSNSNPVHSGSAALAATINQAWAGLYLNSSSLITVQASDNLHFWLHGGSQGGQSVRVVLVDASGEWGTPVELTPVANSWQEVTLSMSQLGDLSQISGIVWQESEGSSQPTFYLDDITLSNGSSNPQPTPTSEPTQAAPTATAVSPTPAPTTQPNPNAGLNVDANAVQHAISPYIYGMNFADETLAAELHLPVNRWGGNATTRYNWRFDTSNRAADWFFENIPNNTPGGNAADSFVSVNRGSSTASLLTVPLIGWTPKSGDYACGYSVSKYGAQQQTDSWRPDCGNGVLSDGTVITWNDPHDTSTVADPGFVQDWVNHLVSTHGSASSGGVQFYNLDNEPMLWNSTHRDVHPDAASYDEMRDRTYQYGAAVKAADPGAQTLGPVVWGWTAYFYSALDQASGGSWWNNPQDRSAHGGTPFVPWYLQQMRAYEQQNGVRILDYLDLHYYPQASGVTLTSAGNAGTQALRLRSTRALWDPSYVDESWINEPVMLIPRMRDWVNANYPGTKLAITEYNWGGLEHINGALAQADVLGIFGREGLDLATLWDPPANNEPGAYAFRMYLNYDGQGSRFGDQSIAANSSNPDVLAIYAARRSSDGALTLMVINKSGQNVTETIGLAGVVNGANTAVYRYSNANLNAIVHEADLQVSNGQLSTSFPASSITLFVVK